MSKRITHYDAYIPYTGFYAACSTDEDLYPKTRDKLKVTCHKCKRWIKVTSGYYS